MPIGDASIDQFWDACIQSLLKTKFMLTGKSFDYLVQLPPMTDPSKTAIMRIAMKAIDTEADNKGRDFGLYNCKLLLCLLHRQYERAVKNADRVSVLKSTQAMSSEIVLANLLEKLLNLTMENAGAQRGFLVLESDEQLFVEAEMSVDSQETTVRQSTPLDSSTALSKAIVNYVARTREPVVLEFLKPIIRPGKCSAKPVSKRLCAKTPVWKPKVSVRQSSKRSLSFGEPSPRRMISHWLF